MNSLFELDSNKLYTVGITIENITPTVFYNDVKIGLDYWMYEIFKLPIDSGSGNLTGFTVFIDYMTGTVTKINDDGEDELIGIFKEKPLTIYGLDAIRVIVNAGTGKRKTINLYEVI